MDNLNEAFDEIDDRPDRLDRRWDRTLGPLIVLPKPVPTGNSALRGDTRPMLGLLLTSSTITEAVAFTRERLK